jgi:hypothetical protein
LKKALPATKIKAGRKAGKEILAADPQPDKRLTTQGRDATS